ncbi:MAG: hypothetical protein Q8932_19955 [Bacteroidota bacterium]|nr:hypothetical protein [Bacteroidota bacterium]
MKKLLLLSIIFSSYFSSAQTMVKTVINVPISSDGLTTEQADVFLPSDFIAGKIYPTIIFCHGTGEAADGGSAGTGLAKIENSLGSGGPVYFIMHGLWPTVFTNPVTEAKEEFIVIAPQAADWDISGDALANVVNYLVGVYAIDVNRIHLTGLSAGGMSVVEYVAQLNPAEAMPSVGTNVRKWKAATCTPMSQATNDPGTSGTWGTVTASVNTSIWGFGDLGDIHGDATFDYVNLVNKAKPGLAKWTSFLTGHGPWNPFYDPAGTFGIYSWMLGIKRTDQVQPSLGSAPPPVVIPPPSIPPPVSGGSAPGINALRPSAYYLKPFPDGHLFLRSSDFKTAGVSASDTLYLSGADTWVSLGMDSLINTDTLHPVVIRWQGSQVYMHMSIPISSNGFGITNCIGLKFDGSGGPGGYGFMVERDPRVVWQGGIGFQISGQSRNIEAQNFYIHSTDRAFDVKNEGDCGGPGSTNLKAWTISSISIHDNKIVKTWNEGMYLGNTSPDNSATNPDSRAVQCGTTVTYPRPGRLSNILIYNNIVDSTGRGGIQLSSASGAVSLIYNNHVTHCGLNGDDGQGVGISTGEYTNAIITGNFIAFTYTWGIACVGTGTYIVISGNIIQSSGYLTTYNLSQVPDTKQFYDPLVEPTFNDTLTWVQAIAILDRPHTDTLKTFFSITGNKIWAYKSPVMAITLENTGTFQNGDSVCGNVLLASATATTSTTPAIVSSQNSAVAFTYVNCSWTQTPPPVVVPPVTQPPVTCPVCPTCPAPKVIKSIVTTTTYVNGVPTTTAIVTFTDGTTQ